jgi:DNA-binding MarR family transcriptional regulator
MSSVILKRKENAMDPKEKQVLEAMKKQGKPVRPGDIAKITQLDGKEVSTIIKNLKKQGKIVSPKQCFYEPV